MRPSHVTTFVISFFFKNVFPATIFIEISPFLGTFYIPIEMEHTLHSYSITNAMARNHTTRHHTFALPHESHPTNNH